MISFNILEKRNGELKTSPFKIIEGERFPTFYYKHNYVYVYNNCLIDIDEVEKHKILYDIYLARGTISKKFFDKNTTKIKGDCLFCGHPNSLNYSHFNMQCIGTLLIAKYYGLDLNKFKIIVHNFKPFHKELLKIVGVNPENILTLKYNILYEIEHCIYSSIFYKPSYNRDFLKLYSKLGEGFIENISEKFYITRENNKSRSIINNDEVIDIIKKHRYKIVDFDKLSVEQQIKLCINANEICAPHGASGANLLYTSDKLNRFVEIFSNGRVTSFHASILQNSNCFYSASIHESINKHQKDFPFYIDLELFKHSLLNNSYQFKEKSEEIKSISRLDELKNEFDKNINSVIYDEDNIINGFINKGEW